jgi:hypothetical protein
MKIACGTSEACAGCEIESLTHGVDKSDATAAAIDVMTGRTAERLEGMSFYLLRTLVDDALEERRDEFPAIGISTVTTQSVRRMSAGKCEPYITLNEGENNGEDI